MSVNLIEDAWLPVLRRSGASGWITPVGLTETTGDPPVALDFPRPDWNAAVSEFLIGILAVALRPKADEDWAERWEESPSPDALAAALQPLAFAFDLDGGGPRAFQDLDSLGSAEARPIASLLIEAPGENTIRKNGDLFNKRGLVEALSPPYAAAALITLQTYAPSGGAGHRTSLRGGGPLTTLISPREGHEVSSLWPRLWANMPEVASGDLPPPGAPPTDPGWARVFPWLAPTRTSEKAAAAVTPDDASELIVFFATPRRIRLDFTPADGEACALGGPESPSLLRSYRTQNYGANYLGWLHPLSPYRIDPTSGKLPLHPRAGPPSWRDWMGWWGFKDTGAKEASSEDMRPKVLRLWAARAPEVGRRPTDADVAVFGFDMDNMKARAWIEQSIPWIPAKSDISIAVGKLVDGAQEAASALRFQAKIAIYGQGQGTGDKRSWRLPDNVPRDAMNELADALWSSTEPRFRRLLRELADDPTKSRDLREGFLQVLRSTALRLFDGAVDMDGLAGKDVRRLVVARDALGRAFAWSGKGAKVAKALGIEPQPTPAREEVT